MDQPRMGGVVTAYAIAAILGWAAAGLGSDVEVKGREIVKSDRRTRKPVTGRQVVAEWQVPQKERSAREKISDRVKELRGELEPKTDRKRAFHDAVTAFESSGSDRSQDHDALIAEMSVRWLQWAEISPKAAVEGTAPLSVGVVRRLYLGLLPFCHELVEREGWRRSLELADLGHPVFTSNFPALANVEVSKSGSIAEAKEFLAETASRPSRIGPSYVSRSLAERWDLNQRDEFLGIVEGQDRVNAAMAFFSRLEGKEATAWLLNKIDEGLFSQEQLSQLGSLSLSKSQGNGLSLEERFGFMDQLRQMGGGEAIPEGQRKQLKTGMVTRELREFLNSEEDWNYQFRHGQVSVEEVMAAAVKSAQEVAEHEKEFRSQLFRHLAEEDVGRAMELYAGSSAEGQNWQKIYAARWWFNDVNPNDYLELMKGIDFEWGQDEIQKSLWAGWHSNTSANLDRYGENYLRWIEDMPSDAHKGRALQTFNNVGRESHPELADQALAILEKMPKGGEE